MNILDLALIAGTTFAAIGGWRLGFLRRFAGWLGVAAGVTLGVVFLPSLINGLGITNDSLTFVVGGMFLVGLASAGQALGNAVGSLIRSGMKRSDPGITDSVGGAVLGVLAVGVVIWLLFPVMVRAQGWPSRIALGSTVTRSVAEALPPPPGQVDTLVRQLAGGHFPTLFDRLTPAPDISEPPSDVEFDPDVYRSATASVVRVEAPACGHLQSGSGFLVADGLVVTNAHVVAGAEDTLVSTNDGSSIEATVVHFDPATDIAVLRAPIDAPTLPLGEPGLDDRGLVMGFPGGGKFDPSPFMVAQMVHANGRDIYDRLAVRRDLLVLGSALAPGDSGSAVLRDDGHVIGVAVAIAPDRPGVAYALNSSELRRVMGEIGPGTESTGSCR